MAFDPEALPVPDLGLRCLNCGYGLAGLPRHRCPECGRVFTIDEHIPKGDFPIVIFNGKEVGSKPEVVELLKRYQIPFTEMMGPIEAIYGLGGVTHSRSRIAVPRASYFAVIDLLRRQALGEELPPVETSDRGDWTCTRCGEENPGNFEVCWNCNQPPSDGS
ncbi:MAG: hypothetical protein JXQ75_19650 [Phycisphaerae bacterium]|nr:hypothetical protein [Phycisphaerae bacterium]